MFGDLGVIRTADLRLGGALPALPAPFERDYSLQTTFGLINR